MTNQESNPASLFRLYVDYGRYTEATNLLLEYIESFASIVSCNLFWISYLSYLFIQDYYATLRVIKTRVIILPFLDVLWI